MGQQEKLKDALATIGNFFQVTCTMVSFNMNNLDSFPLMLLHMSEFVDLFTIMVLRIYITRTWL